MFNQSRHFVGSSFFAVLIEERGHNIGRALYPAHHQSVRFPIFVHFSPAFYKKRAPRRVAPARASVIVLFSTVLSGLVIVHRLTPGTVGTFRSCRGYPAGSWRPSAFGEVMRFLL